MPGYAQRASSYVSEATPSPNDYAPYRAISNPGGEFRNYANDYESGDGGLWNADPVYSDYGQDSYYYGGTGTATPNASSDGVNGRGPVNAEDMYRELEFNPDGYGEEVISALNPVDALRAYQASQAAMARTAELYPEARAHNDEADAFRHAYWNYLMTQSIGGEEAKKFGDSHEITGAAAAEAHGQDVTDEVLMDLYNNNMGRTLAQDPENAGRDPAEVIQEAIATGDLRTTPFELENN